MGHLTEMSTNPRYFLSQLPGTQSTFLFKKKKKCKITISKAYLTWDETEMYYLLKIYEAPGTLHDLPEEVSCGFIPPLRLRKAGGGQDETQVPRLPPPAAQSGFCLLFQLERLS